MNGLDTKMKNMENKDGKAQVYISRHRIGSDGDGIRTLLSFTGCNLDCKFCINKELRSITPDGKWYSPQELLDEVLVDKYYFLVSDGGVTFSGGEPLLHAEFIREFAELAIPHGMNIYVETSLNVAEEAVKTVERYVSKWIVDIKDSRPEVYERYTGCSMDLVNRNFLFLWEEDASVHMRVPVIPGYNTETEVNNALQSNNLRWAEELEKFDYITCRSEIPEADGKDICKVLKSVRMELASRLNCSAVPPASRILGIFVKPKRQSNYYCVETECNNAGNCLGTCPRCDMEMETISRGLDALSFRDRNELIGEASRCIRTQFRNEFAINGIINPRHSPSHLMGDIKPSHDSWLIKRINDIFSDEA